MNPADIKGASYRPVLVVGAGPVGLTAALALRHHDIPVTILEAENPGRLRPGSRAIFLHRATLEILETLSPGLGFTLSAHGVVWPEKRTLFRGKEVYKKIYPPPQPGVLPPFTSLPQVEMERFLFLACERAGVEFLWSSSVQNVIARSEGVTVVTDSGATWSCDYVIGADGAHSSVRHAAGIAMEGTRSPNTFIVVDVKEDSRHPLPLARVFHYEHPAVGGRNVLFVPFAGGWRIDLQLLDGDDVDAYSGLDGVRSWLPLVMDRKYGEAITWVSTYQFLQVVAETFSDSHRRILLVGEAAHLFAPFGARGMNSGVADALSAAVAIKAALQAEHPDRAREAVSRFDHERHLAALYNRDAAGIALEHIQGTSLGMRAKRYIGAALAPAWPDLGRWLDEGPYGPRSGPPTLATKY